MKYYELAALWWSKEIRKSNKDKGHQFLKNFEKELSKLIKNGVNDFKKIKIFVDGSSSNTIAIIAKKNNLDASNLSTKTKMYISENKVEVYKEDKLIAKFVFYN